jgi:hypothetical protein
MLHHTALIISCRDGKISFSLLPFLSFSCLSQFLLYHHVKELLQRRCDANILRGAIGVK